MMRATLLFGLVLLPVVSHAQTAEAQPAWVTWRDPNEGAFMLEVPQGWNVVGGLVRQPSGNTINVLEMRSPDGTMEVGLNDKDLAVGILPVPMYAQMRPGTPMGSGSVLADYESGEAFAQEYGAAVFSRSCGRAVALTGHQAAPVAQSGVPGIPNSSSTAGVATFRCVDQQHGFFALVMARTDLMPFLAPGRHVDCLHGRPCCRCHRVRNRYRTFSLSTRPIDVPCGPAMAVAED